ncbi:hypothetical protein U9M48_013631 [Paspalum notatum var. saurae]|uniref:Uncharacterized protein n=1 Tax=Paspalum notatum var. saurae TaxID=547442 RepID=A0AAQ3WJR8_PASNO
MVKLDHGIEEPTQDLPLIEKPDDKWNREQEDGVSLISSVPVTRGCLGQSLTTRQTNFSLVCSSGQQQR